jgi:1-acyl-sn-glycerol-3-phosphate acyltransferase
VRRALRLLRIALHLAHGYAICRLIYPFAGAPARRALRRAWALGVLRILGVRLRAPGLRVAPGTLLVANHVSWLDAVALQALLPAAIVAKTETRRWPVLGAMLARNETLFVDRRPARSLLAVNADIGARLARGEVVVIFPEGTTTGGDTVLPFRPALFEPAVRGAHPVQALALRYRDWAGRPCRDAAYVERMTLWQSLRAIAGLAALSLEVRACGEARVGARRRDAARRAHAAVQRSVCGGETCNGCRVSPGTAGSGSPAGWTPSSAAPTWASSAEVSRT